MTAKNVIISLYPLTTADVAWISEILGGAVGQVVLSNITAKGYLEFFRLLRTLDADHLYFPITDTNNIALVPLFKVLGMISNSRKNYIVMPDSSVTLLGHGAGIIGCVKVFYGIFNSSWLLVKDLFRVKNLLNSPRTRILRRSSESVLFIKQTLWFGLKAGGSIAHARGVIKGFLGQERNVDLLSLESRLPILAMEGLNILESETTLPYIIPRVFNYSQFNKKVINTLLSFPFKQYGVIYQRLSPGSFSGVIVSRIRKIPLIIEYNGSESWLAKNWGSSPALIGFVEKVERVCLMHAHLVVTVSDVLKDELVERGVESNRIVSYPNGVDPEEFNSERFSDSEISKLRNDLEISENAVLLTFVGTFGHWHGVDFLTQVLISMAENDPQWFEQHDIYICFVGDGAKRQAVESMIAGCSLKHRFKIIGMVPQEMTPLYMVASDILLSPHVPNPDGSPFFGSPTKLFEYMASGRPVIASDLFQIGEVLEGAPHVDQLPPSGSLPMQEQCGVLVTPMSSTELVRAIQFLVENPQWRRAAGRNARERALSKYTWERHTAEISRGLDKVIGLQESRESKPTKVLVNALHAKTGGGVTYLKNILPLISANPDFELHLCIHEDQQDILPELADSISLHTFNFKQGFWRLPLWEQIEVPRLARKIGADVTFSPANYGPFFAPNPVIMLRNALGVALVERRPVKMVYWLLVSIGTLVSMITCRRVIAVSEYARDSNFGPLSGFLRNRFSVIPHGVSAVFSPPDSGSDRQDFVLAVSDIYVQKNLKNLLHALAILRSEKPDIMLKIAGRFIDEVYHRELINIVIEKGLQDNVEFLGGVYDGALVDLYRHCAVFIFPSTVETFGNPLIEAMASGAPIACSNTAAMPEVAGEAALYFDPYNVDDMAVVIGRLLADRELCQGFSAKALARAKNYSWERTAECTLDVLYQAVQEA
ncbi:MAG: glycosyltransferase [Rhodospirillales bacterium]|nr:glycosyltransferase [Rhodospirillales bacterium]